MLPILVKLGIYVSAVTSSMRTDGSSGASEIMRVPENVFCTSLSKIAAELDIDLYVFSPHCYDSKSGQLHAYRYRDGIWHKERAGLPDIIYDRCFYHYAEERVRCKAALKSIYDRKPHLMLSGGRLPGKWEVYTAMKGDAVLAPFLPPTYEYNTHHSPAKWIEQYADGLFMKPTGGMQGKGVLSIQKCRTEWNMVGRSRSNQVIRVTPPNDESMQQWMKKFVGSSRYIIQPLLKLTNPDSKPFDIRVLLQKNERGRWTLSGTALRCGQQGSVTSNLHGGGTAYPAELQLKQWLDAETVNRVFDQLKAVSKRAAERLEHTFGRFAELGFDFGIEQDGTLWLLEANSKPGRASFRQMKDLKMERHSLEKPLLYARLLSRRLYPSFGDHGSAGVSNIFRANFNRLPPDNVQEVHP